MHESVFHVDPESVHLNVDVPFIEHLQELVQHGMGAAHFAGKVVVIHHEETVDELPGLEGESRSWDALKYKDYDAEFFARCHFQCPRDADLAWQEQHDAPRPWPSILIRPAADGQGMPEVVIANKDLCNHCVHAVHRAAHGHCNGRSFEALPAVLAP